MRIDSPSSISQPVYVSLLGIDKQLEETNIILHEFTHFSPQSNKPTSTTAFKSTVKQQNICKIFHRCVYDSFHHSTFACVGDDGGPARDEDYNFFQNGVTFQQNLYEGIIKLRLQFVCWKSTIGIILLLIRFCFFYFPLFATWRVLTSYTSQCFITPSSQLLW